MDTDISDLTGKLRFYSPYKSIDSLNQFDRNTNAICLRNICHADLVFNYQAFF